MSSASHNLTPMIPRLKFYVLQLRFIICWTLSSSSDLSSITTKPMRATQSLHIKRIVFDESRVVNLSVIARPNKISVYNPVVVNTTYGAPPVVILQNKLIRHFVSFAPRPICNQFISNHFFSFFLTCSSTFICQVGVAADNEHSSHYLPVNVSSYEVTTQEMQ